APPTTRRDAASCRIRSPRSAAAPPDWPRSSLSPLAACPPVSRERGDANPPAARRASGPALFTGARIVLAIGRDPLSLTGGQWDAWGRRFAMGRLASGVIVAV